MKIRTERPQCWTILDRNWARETIGPSFAGHATKISHRQAGGARWAAAISGRATDAPGTARQALIQIRDQTFLGSGKVGKLTKAESLPISRKSISSLSDGPYSNRDAGSV